MSLDDEAIASFIESFDERARLSNARSSDEDDERVFSSSGLDSYTVSIILGIKNNLRRVDDVSLRLDNLNTRALQRLGFILIGNTSTKSLMIYREPFYQQMWPEPNPEDSWLWAGIRANKSLQKLSCISVTFELGILEPFLVNNNALTELKLMSCGLGSTGIHVLGELLMQRTRDSIEEINLHGDSFDGNGMDTLTNAVKQSKALKRLILRENGINGKAIPSLATLLRSTESELEELDLRKNSICAEDALTLIESLEGNTKLRTLNLEGNTSITEEGWASIAKRVSHLVYNESSISSVAGSNHTLSSLGSPYDPYHGMPVNRRKMILMGRKKIGLQFDDFGVQFDQFLDQDENNLVRASLWLNFSYGTERQSIKARRKVFWGQIRGDLQVGDASIDIGLMPRVIALVGYVYPCVSHCPSCCEESAKHLQYPPEDRPVSTTRLEVIYNIVRARPELCSEKHSIEEKLRAKNQMLRFEIEGLEEEIKRLKSQLAASSGK